MKPLAAVKLAHTVGGCLLTGRPKPLAAFLYLSFKCNLHCTYCNLPNPKSHELKTEQWLAIIDQLAELGCRRINFIGGEPLLHPGRAAACSIRLDHTSTGNAAEHGVEAVWRELHSHNCSSCYSPCQVELNHLFSFKPRALVNFVRRHVPRLS